MRRRFFCRLLPVLLGFILPVFLQAESSWFGVLYKKAQKKVPANAKKPKVPVNAKRPNTPVVANIVKGTLVLASDGNGRRCRSVALTLKKDHIAKNGNAYASYSPRSAVFIGRHVVLGDRSKNKAMIYDLEAIKKPGAKKLLPVKIVDLPGARHLKRLTLNGHDYLVNAYLEVFKLDKDLSFQKTKFGTSSRIRWNDLAFVREGGTQVLALSGKGLYLIDLEGVRPPKRIALEYAAERLAVVGTKLYMAERTSRRKKVCFSVWRLPMQKDGTVGRPHFLARGKPIDAWCCHLVRAGRLALAGVEYTERGRPSSLLSLNFTGGTVKIVNESSGHGVRGLLGTGAYAMCSGKVLELVGNDFVEQRTYERVRTADGFPYFGDRRGKMLVLPGNPGDSAVIFLEEFAFEEWK